jgi:RNA polymerase sigma-70 factor, ECF subfamily
LVNVPSEDDLSRVPERSTYEDDGDIAAGMRRRDPLAMEVLYDRYSRQAFGLAYRILGDGPSAEDVVQEAFMTVWRQAEKLDAARGKLQSYVLTVVHHKAIDVVRSRKNLASRQLSVDPPEVQQAGPDFTERVDAALDGEKVRRALELLPDDQREAVEMAYYQGLTHSEMSERLGVPLGTVKSRLRLALDKMRATLGAGSIA